MFTNQETFNKVYLGAKAQGFKPSVNIVVTETNGSKHTGYFCKYRSENGLKCHVGHLIEDKDYLPEFDTKNLPVIALVNDDNYNDCLHDYNITFLGKLQDCHDFAYTQESIGENRVYSPEVCQQKLIQFAEDNGLTIPDGE